MLSLRHMAYGRYVHICDCVTEGVKAHVVFNEELRPMALWVVRVMVSPLVRQQCHTAAIVLHEMRAEEWLTKQKTQATRISEDRAARRLRNADVGLYMHLSTCSLHSSLIGWRKALLEILYVGLYLGCRQI
jgi:hypothetical protein